MATKKVESIEIKPVEIIELDVQITGDSPLIMHRWSEKAKREILDKEMGKTKKAREIWDGKNPWMDLQTVIAAMKEA